jgi:hypothetical protein
MILRWIVALLLLHIMLWLLLKPPVPHSDDWVYVQEGKRMMTSEYSLSESPKSHRFMVIVPVALSVRMFGESPFAVSLWPMLCSLMTIAGTGLLLRNRGMMAVIASALISFNVIQVIYSSVAFPDAIVSLFALMTVGLVQYRQSDKPVHALALAVTLVAGFFAKQIMLLLIPYLMYQSWKDFKNHQCVLYWKAFYFFSFLLATAVLILSGVMTGEWFFLLQSVEEYHNKVFVNYTGTGLLYRLTAEPLVFLFHQAGYWPLLLTAWPAMLLKDAMLKAWKEYTAFILFLLWLGTTSFYRWAPLPLLDRMWMLLIVPLSILSAGSLTALLQQKFTLKIRIAFYLMFIASSLLALFSIHQMRALMMLMFPLFFLMAEKWVIVKGGKQAALFTVMFPYLWLALWFAYQNSHW